MNDLPAASPPASEFDIAEPLIWQLVQESGHLDCGGWKAEFGPGTGRVWCSCGETLVDVRAPEPAP